MEQISVDANHVQGAARQHTKEFDIRKFVADLRRDDPDLTLDEAIHAMVDFVLVALGLTREDASDMAPMLAICDYATSNNWAALTRESWRVSTAAQRQQELREPTPSAVVERPVRAAPQPIHISTEQIAAQVEVEMRNALTQIILPNGKSLFDSTREEILEFRNDLTKLIGRLRPGQTPRQAGITSF